MATVTLNWNQPSDQLGGIATGYDVWRKEGTQDTSSTVTSDSNGDITGWTKLTSSEISATTFADGTLASGATTYGYTVTASNTGGYSDGCVPVNVSGLASGS